MSIDLPISHLEGVQYPTQEQGDISENRPKSAKILNANRPVTD
jgi:hypothetical protein